MKTLKLKFQKINFTQQLIKFVIIDFKHYLFKNIISIIHKLILIKLLNIHISNYITKSTRWLILQS